MDQRGQDKILRRILHTLRLERSRHRQFEPGPFDQINPYDYLVDVLQRVGEHPASKVAELTPRHWKMHFADQPLRSALHTRPVA